ncbi:MAG TPA: undecaprenyl diphosphate synthase family protein, partial [Actinotalea sp.]|nr:undecaprenyl diphosphate synthase family protein [Actinotalea sp.]
MRLPNPLYGVYERHLARALPAEAIPRHIGVILDGNRRWARTLGAGAAHGHRAGADKIAEVLGWCEEVGVDVVTLWMLSTDNLTRDADELGDLLTIIAEAVTELAASRRWRLQVMGALELLPPPIASALGAAQDTTAGVAGLHVNIAVGYGGGGGVARAGRAMLPGEAGRGPPPEGGPRNPAAGHIAPNP